MRINAGLDGFWIVMVRISYGHCHNRTTVLSLLTLKPAQYTLNDLLQRLMMDNYFSIQEYLQYLPVILVLIRRERLFASIITSAIALFYHDYQIVLQYSLRFF